MKKLIIISCLSIVLVGLIFCSLGCRKLGQVADYISVPVTKRTIVQSVEASGTVNPVKTVNIGSQVSGIIKEIYVDHKKGKQFKNCFPFLLYLLYNFYNFQTHGFT